MTTAIQHIGFAHTSGQPLPVEIILLSELRQRSMDHSIYDPTQLDFHLIQFIVSGRGKHLCDFESIHLQAGDLLIVRANQVHAFDPDSQHDAQLLAFTPDAIHQAPGVVPHWAAGRAIRPHAKDFRLLVDLLSFQQRLDQRSADLAPQHLAPHLLATLLAGVSDVLAAQDRSAPPSHPGYQSIVRRFENILDRQHATTRSVAWYADHLHLTPRTLARACQTILNLTPKQAIDNRVALEAKRLLSTTDHSVESIGLALGFTESTNFIKFFKRTARCTPDEFRKLR
ncbi:MAG: helix-turn-helix transcriptional regulator [Planctomycetota bacterium]